MRLLIVANEAQIKAIQQILSIKFKTFGSFCSAKGKNGMMISGGIAHVMYEKTFLLINILRDLIFIYRSKRLTKNINISLMHHAANKEIDMIKST